MRCCPLCKGILVRSKELDKLTMVYACKDCGKEIPVSKELLRQYGCITSNKLDS